MFKVIPFGRSLKAGWIVTVFF